MLLGYKRKISLLTLLIIGGLVICLSAETCFSAQNPVVVVLRPRELAPYNEALIGFKGMLKQEGTRVKYVLHDLIKYKGKEDNLVKQIQKVKPDLIFAIGTQAALFSKKNIKDVQVVFSMVLNPVENKVLQDTKTPGGNITGASLNIPIQEQFKRLKQILPNVREIGFLYDSKTKEAIKNQANIAATEIGASLVSRSIVSKSEVLNKLSEVLKASDVLWAGVDTFIYNTRSSKQILLKTLRYRKPFMAFSASYVKAGALFALECDYKDIGRQSGESALRILKGELAGNIPVTLPRKVIPVINRRTAQLIGVDVTEALLDPDVKVYGEE